MSKVKSLRYVARSSAAGGAATLELALLLTAQPGVRPTQWQRAQCMPQARPSLAEWLRGSIPRLRGVAW